MRLFLPARFFTWVALQWGVRLLVMGVFFLAMSLPAFALERDSAGSGFIVSADGYILTNFHVVDGATEIEVHTADGMAYSATVVAFSDVWSEGGNDIALLKIEADSLPTVLLGNSDEVQLFDEVIALGFPLSFQIGATVNATGGHVTSFKDFSDTPALLQIDAAINPGNSGGALLNLHGEVIGIPTASLAGSDSRMPPQGVNWAVPVNYGRSLLREHLPNWQDSIISRDSVSAQQAVARALPAIVYIKTASHVPLVDLVPQEALGATLEISEGSPFTSPSYVEGQLTLDPTGLLTSSPSSPSSPSYSPSHWEMTMTGTRGCFYNLIESMGGRIMETAEAAGSARHEDVDSQFAVVLYDVEDPSIATEIYRYLGEEEAVRLTTARQVYVNDPFFGWGRQSVRVHVSSGSTCYVMCFMSHVEHFDTLSSTTLSTDHGDMDVVIRFGTTGGTTWAHPTEGGGDPYDPKGRHFYVTGRAVIAYEEVLAIVMLQHHDFVLYPAELGSHFYLGVQNDETANYFTPDGLFQCRACEHVSELFPKASRECCTLESNILYDRFTEEFAVLVGAALDALGVALE